ncbi:hypothetical protein [Hymenobacter siberiensis]|uniref:hypothetical protein n=1 Tax=Hymenobacter siberiensis TaxID=2848396 RepID=UPI001C1DF29D|nr:hypothetical protein [Hymenobacter siberiensis]
MDYFDQLFGKLAMPEPENWRTGTEPKPVLHISPGAQIFIKVNGDAAEAIRQAWQKDTNDPHSASYGLPTPGDTIDIDYEEVP